MKASELRIGNYVYRDNEVINFSEIDWDYIVNRTFLRTPMELYEPIPLTEEWLLKFGFEKDLDSSFVFGLLSIFKDKRFKQNVYIYTESSQTLSEGQWVVINDLKVQYVHTLQNLYFALTNEELTLETN